MKKLVLATSVFMALNGYAYAAMDNSAIVQLNNASNSNVFVDQVSPGSHDANMATVQLLSGPFGHSDNLTVDVDQIGDNNVANAMAMGLDDHVVIYQNGSNLTGSAMSQGKGSVAMVTQTGSNNIADATSHGKRNYVSITQQDMGNYGFANVHGRKNTAILNQYGYNNQANVLIDGKNNFADVNQYGVSNIATTNLLGKRNNTSIYQGGFVDTASATTSSGSVGNTFTITQYAGHANQTGVEALNGASYNNATLSSFGLANTINTSFDGPDAQRNTVVATANGEFNTITTSAAGRSSGNTAMANIMGLDSSVDIKQGLAGDNLEASGNWANVGLFGGHHTDVSIQQSKKGAFAGVMLTGSFGDTVAITQNNYDSAMVTGAMTTGNTVVINQD